MPTVLIISDSLDIHSNIVEKELLKYGISVARFNTDTFASDNGEIILTKKIKRKEYIILKDVCYPLNEIISVWYRRPGLIETKVNDIHQKTFAQEEIGELVRQLYFYLDKTFWISPYLSLEAARPKIPQLRIAEFFGMKTPRTIATNSPSEIRSFF